MVWIFIKGGGNAPSPVCFPMQHPSDAKQHPDVLLLERCLFSVRHY